MNGSPASLAPSRPSTKLGWVRTVLCLTLALACFGFEWEGRVDRLTRELTTADAPRRRDIVRLLAGYPVDRVRPALLRALTDPDLDVRAEAARAAGRVRLREATPELVEWLEDLDTNVRESAARALGQIGDRSVISNLVRALGDASPDVRIAALEALAELGGPEATVPVLGRLDDDDAQVRAAATRAATTLAPEVRPRAVVPLIGRARDDAPEVREAAFQALGALRDERAIPALVQGLRDGVPDVRLAAVAALGRIGSARAIDPLARLLAEPDRRLRDAAIAALAPLPDPRAAEAIIDAMTGEASLQASARAALIHRAEALPTDRTLVPAVARRLADSSHREATNIATVLVDLTRERPDARILPALASALTQGRGAAPMLLVALGQTGAEGALVPLLRHVTHDEPTVRAAAIRALEAYFGIAGPDGRAADPLMRALPRETGANQRRIVRLLGQIRARRALVVLRPLLEHGDAGLRGDAVRAIGDIGDAEGSELLWPLLDDRDAATRYEVALALGRVVDAAGITRLRELVESRDPTDRHALLAALALGAPRVGDALGERESQALVAALTRILRGRDRPLAARALRTLARWGAQAAAAPIVEHAEHGRGALRRQALTLLGHVDAPAARAAARQALGNGDPRIVAAAASSFAGPAAVAAATPEDITLLYAAVERPWPAPAAATGALARWAALGKLDDTQAAPTCALLTRRDAHVRANALVILAATGARCERPVPAAEWMTPEHAPVVRAASAVFLRRGADAGRVDEALWAAERRSCAERELSASVSHVCRATLPPIGDEAPLEALDAHVYAGDGARLRGDSWTAVRFADGTTWLAFTDLNGQLYLGNAPSGPVWLEDPAAIPLEP